MLEPYIYRLFNTDMCQVNKQTKDTDARTLIIYTSAFTKIQVITIT